MLWYNSSLIALNIVDDSLMSSLLAPLLITLFQFGEEERGDRHGNG